MRIMAQQIECRNTEKGLRVARIAVLVLTMRHPTGNLWGLGGAGRPAGTLVRRILDLDGAEPRSNPERHELLTPLRS